jgi:hypothetical protein
MEPIRNGVVGIELRFLQEQRLLLTSSVLGSEVADLERKKFL